MASEIVFCIKRCTVHIPLQVNSACSSRNIYELFLHDIWWITIIWYGVLNFSLYVIGNSSKHSHLLQSTVRQIANRMNELAPQRIKLRTKAIIEISLLDEHCHRWLYCLLDKNLRSFCHLLVVLNTGWWQTLITRLEVHLFCLWD